LEKVAVNAVYRADWGFQVFVPKPGFLAVWSKSSDGCFTHKTTLLSALSMEGWPTILPELIQLLGCHTFLQQRRPDDQRLRGLSRSRAHQEAMAVWGDLMGL
jgi:hypothetical protein